MASQLYPIVLYIIWSILLQYYTFMNTVALQKVFKSSSVILGIAESDTTERLHFHFSLSCLGEGNGNPLQCSCLENPRDGGAWWAAVYGVAQSRTQLKRLSSSSSSAGLSCVSWIVISIKEKIKKKCQTFCQRRN